MCVFPFELLRCHSHNDLAEVASFQHADKGFGRLVQTVEDVLAIANAAVRDAGSDLAQEFGVVLFSKFIVGVVMMASIVPVILMCVSLLRSHALQRAAPGDHLI